MGPASARRPSSSRGYGKRSVRVRKNAGCVSICCNQYTPQSAGICTSCCARVCRCVSASVCACVSMSLSLCLCLWPGSQRVSAVLCPNLAPALPCTARSTFAASDTAVLNNRPSTFKSTEGPPSKCRVPPNQASLPVRSVRHCTSLIRRLSRHPVWLMCYGAWLPQLRSRDQTQSRAQILDQH